jgi:DMSO/TMAO reductase YedYZ molybdopterin-dependent catalytic subunit
MSRRVTNIVLLAATAVLVVTGLVAWVLPESKATLLYDLHRITGVALVLVLPWKELVARMSLGRRARSASAATARSLRSAIGSARLRAVVADTLPGLLAGVALALTVGLGLAWTLDLVSFDRPIAYSAMNVHVFAGLALVPLVAWHALQRWEPPRARDLSSRRTALRLLGIGGLAVVGGVVVERFPIGRRVTGSKHAGSFTGNAFPQTIWAFDEIPAVDPSTWRLEITGATADRTPLTLEAVLAGPSREVDAIIDCTGGWWSEQRWRGLSLMDLLLIRGISPAASSVTVRSVTGHSWSYPLEDLRDAVLATHVGGEPLSPGHGAPVRLVVPGRRGFQWIKWVSRVDVS